MIHPDWLACALFSSDFTFKEGPFTTTEKSQVWNFLQKYRGVRMISTPQPIWHNVADSRCSQSRNLTEQQLADMINASGKSARQQHGTFWKDLGVSQPSSDRYTASSG